LWALAAVVAVTLAGCAGEASEEPTPAPTVTETFTQSPAAVDKKAPPAPAQTWPLTGVPGEVADRPAVAVKIENSPESRPQTGLEDADIVWEEIVEGGIARYIAVWHSVMPSEIGPIRSIRPMDGNIVGPLHGLMVCSGGKAPFIATARDAELQVLTMDGGDRGFYRVNTRPAPHNVYADPADFLAQADTKHSASPVPQFAYAPSMSVASAATAGADAPTIAVAMSGGAHPAWTWDPTAEVWERSEGENPAEAASGTRLTAANVVAMKVDVRTAQGRDPAGNSIPESIVIGEGTGFVASAGKILHIQWSKESATAVAAITDDDGHPVTLAPGPTWVELVPSNGSWETVGGTEPSPSTSTSGTAGATGPGASASAGVSASAETSASAGARGSGVSPGASPNRSARTSASPTAATSSRPTSR
jgi:hypothetical protein